VIGRDTVRSRAFRRTLLWNIVAVGHDEKHVKVPVGFEDYLWERMRRDKGRKKGEATVLAERREW
jgi:hypothetical protein